MNMVHMEMVRSNLTNLPLALGKVSCSSSTIIMNTFGGETILLRKTTLHTYKLPLEPTKLYFSPFGIKHQKEDREKESVAHGKRVRELHSPLLLGLPLHGRS